MLLPLHSVGEKKKCREWVHRIGLLSECIFSAVWLLIFFDCSLAFSRRSIRVAMLRPLGSRNPSGAECASCLFFSLHSLSNSVMIIFVLCKSLQKCEGGEARGSGQATSWLPTWLGTKWGKLGLAWLGYVSDKLGTSSNNG